MNRQWFGPVLAIGATLAGSAAADVSPRALARNGRAAQTPESRCASPMCQSVTEDDSSEPSSEPAGGEPPPFSVALGLGAAWFRARVSALRTWTVDEASSGGSAGVQAPIDSGADAGPLSDPEYEDESFAAYPTLSLTLDMQQPLVSFDTVDLRIAERFSIAAAPSVDDRSTVVGFADILLGVHVDDFPVQAGIGPGLGVATVRDAVDDSGEALLVGITGIVRVTLPGLPGTLDAVVRSTRLLASSPEAGSYRDAQLAYAFPL